MKKKNFIKPPESFGQLKEKLSQVTQAWKGGTFMPSLQQLKGSFKNWVAKARRFAIEESKVITIRAKEAGQLTALNSRKHKMTRELQMIHAQLGQTVIALLDQRINVATNPKIEELSKKAHHLQHEIERLDSQAEGLKKSSDDQVEDIHRKVA